MALTYGTEPRPEFYSFELAAAAHRLVTEMRPIRPGQQVAITADTLSDLRAVEATARAVYAVGGIPSVFRYPANPQPCMDPPAPVAAGLPRADVWIDFAVAYHLYSPAYYAAVAAGCIYVCLTGMDADMMVRTVGRVPYRPLREMADRLYRLSQAAEIIRVTAPSGTDLTMRVDKAGDPFWEPPPETGGYPQMLGGQSGFMAVRENFEAGGPEADPWARHPAHHPQPGRCRRDLRPGRRSLRRDRRGDGADRDGLPGNETPVYAGVAGGHPPSVQPGATPPGHPRHRTRWPAAAAGLSLPSPVSLRLGPLSPGAAGASEGRRRPSGRLSPL